MALDIKAWDEVITTAHSAVATALAVLNVGATPIFVDIDDYYHIDADKIEEKITPRTKAILPVHLYGQSCDLDKIRAICEKYNLALIEDCAQAHFTQYDGKYVGTLGNVWCFSFYPTKNLWAYGDAGAITTADKNIYDKCRMIKNYGQENRYEHKIYWVNSRMDEIQAAILQVQLKYVQKNNSKRNIIAQKYMEQLKNIPQVVLPKLRDKSSHVFHLFVIQCERRDELMVFLKEKGIPSLIHYPISIHKQPFLKGKYDDISLPVLEAATKRILSLPIHPYLSDEEIIHIVSCIKLFYQG